jgi:hypothetical protein
MAPVTATMLAVADGDPPLGWPANGAGARRRGAWESLAWWASGGGAGDI